MTTQCAYGAHSTQGSYPGGAKDLGLFRIKRGANSSTSSWDTSGRRDTRVPLTPTGDPAGNLLDRLRGSSQGHTAFREATTICREEERFSAQRASVGTAHFQDSCNPL